MAHIRIGDITPRVAYTVGGSAQSAFTVPFPFFVNADLVVYKGTTKLALTTDYTVTGAGLDSGGIVTLNVAVTSTTVTIYRDVLVARTTDFPDSGPFQTPALNTQLDQLTAMVQQVNARTIHVPSTEGNGSYTIPPLSDRASKAAGYDSAGNLNAIVTVPIGSAFFTATGTAFVASASVVAANALLGRFTTRTTAAAATISSALDAIFINGYAAAGDGGHSTYKRVGSIGAGKFGFTSADGASWQLFEAHPNVLMFGADPTGVVSSTTAMQAAHNTGDVVYYPEGSYGFTTLSFAAGGIVGASMSKTHLITTSLGALDCITFTGNGGEATYVPPVFEKFTLRPSGAKSGGSGIRFTPTSGEMSYARIISVQTSNISTGIRFDAASNWLVADCIISSFNSTGIYIDNTNAADSGDNSITNCLIGSSLPSTICIDHHSSGGLKVVGCKLNGGAVGYRLGFTGAANTGDLNLAGNSIENMANQAILIGRASGSNTFGHICITGNQIAINPIGIQFDISGAIYDISVTGNVITMGATTGQGIIMGVTDNFVVSGNTIRGNGGTTQGLTYSVTSTNGLFIGNQIMGTGVANASASGSVRMVSNPT